MSINIQIEKQRPGDEESRAGAVRELSSVVNLNPDTAKRGIRRRYGCGNQDWKTREQETGP
jgi:hypothetical protein